MDGRLFDVDKCGLMVFNESGVSAEPLLYSLEETRKALGGISLSTLYNLRTRGQLKILKLGSRSFCDRKQIEKLVAQLSKSPNGRIDSATK